MNYDSRATIKDERRDANATLCRVIAVRQSTQIVRRRGRRVETHMVLGSGSNRVAVRVDEVLYTGSTKAAPRWQVGDMISIPDPKGLKDLILPPNALKPARWDRARRRLLRRSRLCLL